jgi:hypothetical protein
MRDFMVTPNDVENEIMVPCKQCTNRVWIRKDRMQKHIQKVHPSTAAPKKSFTTYKARIASTFPPKVLKRSVTVKSDGVQMGTTNIILVSRRGQRIGKGICAECGIEQLSLWRYSESNQGAVDVCSGCKQKVFDRSFS